MKRIMFGAVVILVLAVAGTAFGLSDEEYLLMKKSSSDFARADREMARVWNMLKKEMSSSGFKILRREQREWLDGWRDEDARMLMQKGYSRLEAYTIATQERTEYIQRRARYITDHEE